MNLNCLLLERQVQKRVIVSSSWSDHFLRTVSLLVSCTYQSTSMFTSSVAHKPAPYSNVVLHDQLNHHLWVQVLQDPVQQYWDPHMEQKSNQHTEQLLKDGGGNTSLQQCIWRPIKNGENTPQRVHYISILHELKLSDISHIRECWNIHEVDWNGIMGTFIEKHKVTPSNCITRN